MVRSFPSTLPTLHLIHSFLLQAWGWVQEMYGFCIALWLGGVKRVDLYLHMMSQPPWDRDLQMAPGKPFHIIHYTYGMDYTLDGEKGLPRRGWRSSRLAGGRGIRARELPA